MKQISAFVAAVLLGIGCFLLWHQAREQQEEIAQLKLQLKGLSQQASLTSATDAVATSSAALLLPTSTIRTNNSSAANPVGVRTWRANAFVRGIDRVSALNDLERDELRRRIEVADERQELGSSLPERRASMQKILTEIIGTTRAERAEQARQEAEQRTIAEEQEALVTKFERRLALTSEQKQQLEIALTQSEISLRPLRQELSLQMEEAMAQHFAPESERTELLQRQEQINSLEEQMEEVRNSIVREQLQDTLSEEQLNALLKLQSE